MTSPASAEPAPPPNPGLCRHCRHARVVPGARSSFWRCNAADTIPQLRRYPPLPVVSCFAYEPPPDEPVPPPG